MELTLGWSEEYLLERAGLLLPSVRADPRGYVESDWHHQVLVGPCNAGLSAIREAVLFRQVSLQRPVQVALVLLIDRLMGEVAVSERDLVAFRRLMHGPDSEPLAPPQPPTP